MLICIDSSALVVGLQGKDPFVLVEKYVNLGLPAKADAFIGAFAEWMNVSYLISENRHFLRQVKTKAFQIMDADEFVKLSELIFDTMRDRYQLLRIGWKGLKRVYHIVLHFDIKLQTTGSKKSKHAIAISPVAK